MPSFAQKIGRSVRNGLLAAMLAPALIAFAQTPAQAQSVIVALEPQDFSDCTNSNVQTDPNRTRGGTIIVTRNGDGTTTVKIGMTVNADTTYHFFLKCVRLLGDIKTDDEGTAEAVFTFSTNAVGPVFAFDMYPEGAPAGNKFQSVQVKFQ